MCGRFVSCMTRQRCLASEADEMSRTARLNLGLAHQAVAPAVPDPLLWVEAEALVPVHMVAALEPSTLACRAVAVAVGSSMCPM